MTTTTPLPAILRAPRVPRECPVSIVHLWRPDYGRHHLYSVHDLRGALVEVISGDDTDAEQRLQARYPWTSTQLAPAFGVMQRCWPVYSGEVKAAEFKAHENAKPWSEDGERIRAMADRCEKHAAVVEALKRVRIDGVRDHPLDGPRTALVYQRPLEHGGDAVSVHLRRAMLAAERAGLVRRVRGDGEPEEGWHGIAKHYRATDSTPYCLGEDR